MGYLTKKSDTVSQTTRELHVYANGTSGNDANNGLTVGTPKLTLGAVLALVPFYIKHNVCVHLAGVFNTTTDYKYLTILTNFVTGTTLIPLFLIDGGSDETVVAGPFTSADIHGTLGETVGKTGSGWTVDAYAGYFVRIDTGVCVGQRRLIQGNTADTLTVAAYFSTDVDACTFTIVRPTTEITGTNTVNIRSIGVTSAYIQRLYVSGSAGLSISASQAGIGVSAVIFNSSSTVSLNYATNNYAALNTSPRDPVTFAADPLYSMGIGQIHSTGRVRFYNCMDSGSMMRSYIKNMLVQGTGGFNLAYGSRVINLEISCHRDLYFQGIQNSSGYPVTRLGGGVTGLLLKDSTLRVGPGVDISGCSSHAIECNSSKLLLEGAVTGSGNGGAGVYAHDQSLVTIKHGAPPTLTGTVGDLAVSDPASAESTWAAIDGGAPVSSTAEMTLVKEVA